MPVSKSTDYNIKYFSRVLGTTAYIKVCHSKASLLQVHILILSAPCYISTALRLKSHATEHTSSRIQGSTQVCAAPLTTYKSRGPVLNVIHLKLKGFGNTCMRSANSVPRHNEFERLSEGSRSGKQLPRRSPNHEKSTSDTDNGISFRRPKISS